MKNRSKVRTCCYGFLLLTLSITLSGCAGVASVLPFIQAVGGIVGALGTLVGGKTGAKMQAAGGKINAVGGVMGAAQNVATSFEKMAGSSSSGSSANRAGSAGSSAGKAAGRADSDPDGISVSGGSAQPSGATSGAGSSKAATSESTDTLGAVKDFTGAIDKLAQVTLGKPTGLTNVVTAGEKAYDAAKQLGTENTSTASVPSSGGTSEEDTPPADRPSNDESGTGGQATDPTDSANDGGSTGDKATPTDAGTEEPEPESAGNGEAPTSGSSARTRGLNTPDQEPPANPAEAEKQSLASRWGFTEVGDTTSDLGDPDFDVGQGAWKTGEADRIGSVLEKLPSSFVQEAVQGAPKIYRTSRIAMRSRPSATVGGITSPDGWIALPDLVFDRPDFEHAIIHEFAHAWALKNQAIEEEWDKSFWASETSFKNPPPPAAPPTSYGKSAFFEDFAESVALYLADRSGFKASQPERAAFIEQHIIR